MIGIALSAAVCLAILGTLFTGVFSYTSVCTHCGIQRHTSELQVRGNDEWILRETHRQTNTPLGDAIRELGLAQGEEHQWSFAQGGGNGISCAIGDGRHIDVSEEAANLLRDVHEFAEEGEAQTFALELLQGLRRDLWLLDYPAGGVSDRRAFRSWWEKAQQISYGY